jgi:hypothetical protein
MAHAPPDERGAEGRAGAGVVASVERVGSNVVVVRPRNVDSPAIWLRRTTDVLAPYAGSAGRTGGDAVSLLVDLAMCALGWRCERGKPRSCGSFVSARRGFRGRWRSRGEIKTIPCATK